MTRSIFTDLPAAAVAGSYRRLRDEPPQDPITQSAWFLREHREVPAGGWKLQRLPHAGRARGFR